MSTEELLGHLFPEPTQAEQLLRLATKMNLKVRDANGQSQLLFQLSGSVTIGPSSESSSERFEHFGRMLGELENQINAQGKARKKSHWRKGGAR
jgi:hypothetical protein